MHIRGSVDPLCSASFSGFGELSKPTSATLEPVLHSSNKDTLKLCLRSLICGPLSNSPRIHLCYRLYSDMLSIIFNLNIYIKGHLGKEDLRAIWESLVGERVFLVEARLIKGLEELEQLLD